MATFRAFLFIVCASLLLSLQPGQASAGADWGPWPTGGNSASQPDSVWSKLFHFYQDVISSDDGAACPFYPTCSAYAYQALTRHGLVYGSLLAIDRLFSEYPGMPSSGLYPLITKYGVHRPYDPVP